MPVHINVAGVWKQVDKVHINVGGVWKECDDVPINVAGAWKTGLLTVDPVVTLASINGTTNSRLDAACYAGQFFGTDGNSEEYTAAGSATAASFTWLSAGAAEDVWVMWTRTGGTLGDWDSLGAGNNNVRLQMNANRAYRLVDTISSAGGGAETIIGYFRLYDAASAGNLLATSATSTWSARRWHDICPLCCFTPETPVTLASGLQVPIASVKEGDEILVFNLETKQNEAQAIDEVITRTGRQMYRIHFESGDSIDASDDHPFHVKGVGPAAIDPVDYKHIGTPALLEVGAVVQGYGRPRTVTGIEPIDYPGTVYTFSNSLFYANGILVY